MDKTPVFSIYRHGDHLGLRTEGPSSKPGARKPSARPAPQGGEVSNYGAHVWLSKQGLGGSSVGAHGARIGVGYQSPDEAEPNSFHVNFSPDEGHLFISMVEFLQGHWDSPITFEGADLTVDGYNNNQDVVFSVEAGHQIIECRRGIITTKKLP